MRRKRLLFFLISCILSASALPGCSEEAAEAGQETESAEEDEKPKDEYEEYIRSALESVNGGKSSNPGADPDPDLKVTDVPMTLTPPADDFYASAMENDSPAPVFPSDDTSPTPTDAEVSPDAGSSTEPTPTPYITPEEFDVGRCCIYINGETDSAYGSEVVTAINKARTDLGYKPLISNKSLATCADRRTREIAASLDHIRPNGLPFYSLAPEYFKAEMLVSTGQKAEEAVDTMIKQDPVSRRLIFTDKYQSIGACGFKCNGREYTVVAFGL
ncbi:MAG: hypothetical protein K6G58_05600 [Lachnospiraceae bacterium]|nr:hypothetical protein [Lachnospiraceae bacterium]